MLPFLHIGTVQINSFGLMFGLSICLGWMLFMRYFRTHGVAVDELVLGAVLVISGFLGARLDSALVHVYVELHGHGSAAAELASIAGGYTYFGSLLAGCLGGYLYGRAIKAPMLRGFDSIFCIAPAYALGRIGCFLAGDGDYGVPTSLPWGISFPHGVVPTQLRVHPTMLYISAWELTVFAILWKLSDPHRTKPLPPGTLLGAYLIATGLGRFFIEFLSRNPVLAFGLTEAQLVGLSLIAAGASFLAWIAWHQHSSRTETQLEPQAFATQ